MKRQYRTPIDFMRNLILLGCLAVIGCTVSVNGISFHNPLPAFSTKTIAVPDKKIVTHDFRCLIIEDVDARSSLPKSQLAMLTGANLRTFLKAHCAKDAKGNPYFRLVDKSTELTGFWSEMKRQSTVNEYPQIIVQNGADYAAMALPKDDWDALGKFLDHHAGVTQ